MIRKFRTMIGAATLLTAAAVASPALACGAPQLKPASYEGTGASFIRTAATPTTIVGLWNVTFYRASDNSVFDTAYVAWHSDGTEIENSIGRSPASENFCMGVWTQVADRVYALNHYAVSYNSETGELNGKVLIKERVKVSPDDMTYTGPFSLTITDPTSGKTIGKVVGTVSATRIVVQ